MNTTPVTELTADELVTSLRFAAAGTYADEAAVELLIRHRTWLTQPKFLSACLYVVDADMVGANWPAVARYVTDADAQPADRAVALIAAQLAGYPEPVDIATMPPLAWLLASLPRDAVDLVLAAISHAAGTHQHVEHVGEVSEAGEWRITATSPRLRPGPLHPWPDLAGPA
jgi:hypothetical protein